MIYGKLQEVPFVVTAKYGYPLMQFKWKFIMPNDTKDEGNLVSPLATPIPSEVTTMQTNKYDPSVAAMGVSDMANETTDEIEIKETETDTNGKAAVSAAINGEYTKTDANKGGTQEKEESTVKHVEVESTKSSIGNTENVEKNGDTMTEIAADRLENELCMSFIISDI